MAQNLDSMSRMIEQKAGLPGLLPWFLMASFLYYGYDISMLSDERYDEIAKTLLDGYDDFEHMHKPFVTKEDLAAGSLYALAREGYPGITRTAAVKLIEGHEFDTLTQIDLAEIYRLPFLPPENVWDRYLYQQGRSYRQYLDGLPEAERLKVDNQFRAQRGEPPLTSRPATTPTVRVRTRPAAPTPSETPAPAVRVRTRPVAPTA